MQGMDDHDGQVTRLGPYAVVGRQVQVECHDVQGRMTADVVVVLPGWIPGIVPDWSFRLVGSATKEHDS